MKDSYITNNFILLLSNIWIIKIWITLFNVLTYKDDISYINTYKSYRSIPSIGIHVLCIHCILCWISDPSGQCELVVTYYLQFTDASCNKHSYCVFSVEPADVLICVCVVNIQLVFSFNNLELKKLSLTFMTVTTEFMTNCDVIRK